MNNEVPEDDTFLQLNEQNKFIGTMMWKFLDFVSFGQLEKNFGKSEEKQHEQPKKPDPYP